jgi:inorganic phosphate transporter, PiT family
MLTQEHYTFFFHQNLQDLLDSGSFHVPTEVILAAAGAIALGTFFGGWRIVKTMAFKLTNLKPYQGLCAETADGAILTSMAWLGIPVSTTHALAGAIMGTGATKRLSAVRWGSWKENHLCLDYHNPC